MNTALVIEPAPQLAAELAARKASASARWPNAPFLRHPPHATLLAGLFETPDHWLSALREALGTVRPFDIQSSSVFTFPDDPAPGFTTVAFNVEESEELRALQQIVAEALAPFRLAPAADALAGLHRRSDAIASARKYGYPWVGAHWRPHFTIGSLPLAANDPAMAEFLKPIPTVRTRVRSAAVWGVAGDEHSTVSQVPLGGA